MLARLLIFLAIALVLFLPLNALVYRQLVRIHPRRRRIVLALVILGNLIWPFIPLLQRSSWIVRVARALLGPMWFGWTSFTILYSAVLFLILLAWIPFRRRNEFAAFARWPSRVFLTLTIIGGIVGFYQAIVPLRIERVPISIAGLPAEADGMRIALVADLHVGLFTRPSRLRDIFLTTRGLRPDIVLLLGDSIDDDPWFVPKLLRGTEFLGSIPTVAVLGNHEMYGNPAEFIRRIRASRIRLLVNEGMAFRGIWLAGMSDYAARQVASALTPDIDASLRGRSPSQVPVVIVHQPRAFDEARARGVPLTLASHTHGGQCGIRPLGWSLAGVFLRYHMGLYRRGDAQLYVNTGTGYWLLPFRLGMTPEITLVELRRAH